MKAMKYLLIGALMIGFGTQVNAQDGSKADVDAVKKLISSKPADLDKQLKGFYKVNKKNADNLVAFGRAFYEAKDTTHAREYANYALAASKNKCAPAFVLLGDIAQLSDDGGAAASFYDQAIYADNKCVEAYKKYALVYRKIDPEGANRKLDELKKNCPEVNVDAIKGHNWVIAGNEKAAYEEFKKVPIQELDKDYLNEFARISYFQAHFEDALAACQQGLKDKPRNPTFNRLAMFSCYELKQYDKAKDYIYKYFNETDSAKFNEYDHYYSAKIYEELGEKENAYSEYDKALKLVTDESLKKRWDILKEMSNSYQKDKDYENAIKYYQEYLACKPDLKFDDEEKLATLYTKYADESEGAKKEELIKKAADIYAAAGEKYSFQKAYATYKRASLIHTLDSNMEKNLAKPHYQELIDLLGSKSNREGNEDALLKAAYHYMMFNSYINKDVPGAKGYAEKILAIDPEYKAAIEIQNLK